jgi:hypothetical protein
MWFNVKLCARYTFKGGLYVCLGVVESRVTDYNVVNIFCVSLCSGEQTDVCSVINVLWVSFCS